MSDLVSASSSSDEGSVVIEKAKSKQKKFKRGTWKSGSVSECTSSGGASYIKSKSKHKKSKKRKVKDTDSVSSVDDSSIVNPDSTDSSSSEYVKIDKHKKKKEGKIIIN